MKRWEILNKIKSENSKLNNEKIIKILLENRGLKDKKSILEFLNPKLEKITIDSVDINKKQLKKAMDRILLAVKNQEQIIVYGDYDVDGITGTAILWETLHNMKAKVLPYLPNRIEEGYGLSIKGISNLKSQISNVKLIITVDNGIVVNEAVRFATENKIDVIITDHHIIGTELPKALAIVHTTKLCGAGIAWLIAKEFKKLKSPPPPLLKGVPKVGDFIGENDSHLELAALGTIADMVPLKGVNRTIVRFGLEKLGRTRSPGLLELFKLAGIENKQLSTYEVGFIIAPRLNAAGRIDNAMDSLRLLCTKDKNKARNLAEKLELTNRERQLIMKQAAEHAIENVKSQNSNLKSIIIVSHESYQQGVIGLVAGKLVEEFYRPSIVVSVGEKYSKASARSINGFNIIEFLRSSSECFVNVGGHPMAAGFTFETEKIIALKESLETAAEKLLDQEILTKTLKIECELPFSAITKELFTDLQRLAPFGMGNPEPIFASRNVTVEDFRILGRDGKHLRLNLKSQMSNLKSEGIAFNMGELAGEIKTGDKIDLAYTIDENTWNGNTKLQLKVKDIKTTLAKQG